MTLYDVWEKSPESQVVYKNINYPERVFEFYHGATWGKKTKVVRIKGESWPTYKSVIVAYIAYIAE